MLDQVARLGRSKFFIDGVNATIRVAIRPTGVEWEGRHLKSNIRKI